MEEGNEQLISPIEKHVWNVATHSLCNLFGMSSIQLTMYTKESFDQGRCGGHVVRMLAFY